ncbi:MAG: YcxB family protein [Schlesneria sp.]
MTPIKVTYRLTLQEFMAACHSHWNTHKQGARANLIFGVIGIIAGAALLPFHWIGGLLIFICLALIAMVIGRSIMWRHAFLDNKKFTAPISLIFGDETIHVETIDGTSDLNWSFYSGYLETHELIMLYMTRRTFSVIPKSAFADANQVRDFMSLVGSKIPSKK